MARIRSIKPEYWSDDKIIQLSLPARLLFIALWNFADDHGRGRAFPREIQGFSFPADDIEISPLMDELESVGLIHLYEVKRVPFFHVPKWKMHQNPSKPTPSKLPEPDTCKACLYADPSLVNEDAQEIPGETQGNSMGIHGKRSAGYRSLEVGVRSQEIGELPVRSNSEKPEAGASTPAEEIFLTIQAKDGQLFNLTTATVEGWKRTFPDRDVEAEIRKAVEWHKANPKKQKTLSGMNRFLFGWLDRDNKLPKQAPQQSTPPRLPAYQEPEPMETVFLRGQIARKLAERGEFPSVSHANREVSQWPREKVEKWTA